MRILITNDDGIYAPGLWELARALKEMAEVFVVAPDREQSGVGSSLSLHVPVRASPVTPLVKGVTAYSVEGTPGDAVILALKKLLPEKVDMLMAGINSGANLGPDVLISGTVGAALHGYFQGLPSIALSITDLENLRYETPLRLALLIAQEVEAAALPKRLLLNINCPNLPLDGLEGLEVTRLGQRNYQEVVQEGHDGRRKYYWLLRSDPQWVLEEGSDVWAVRNNRISVTPLHSDITSPDLRALLEGLGQGWLQVLRGR